MGRASHIIGQLKSGETVVIRPAGQSMHGMVESGSLVRIRPLSPDEPLAAGDVVLCRVRGHAYLHLIQLVDGDRYLIGNNIGGTNGWTARQNIYGKLDAILE